MTTPFDFLASCYTFVIGDRLLPALGAYGIGTVAAIMPDEESASDFLESISADLLAQYEVKPSILPIGDPMKFMRRAAGEGFAGIEGAIPAEFAVRYMFMVRVEEAGSALPTVLASLVNDQWNSCLTRAGVQHLTHAEVLHWQRFDILDPVNAKWGVRSPFRDWNQGDPLYELRSETHVVVLSDVGLLGDWNSPAGSFAFFTTKERALEYHKEYLGNGRNKMLPVAIAATQDPHELMAKLVPWCVYDLRIRLHQLTKINLDAAWCVNPVDHRENTAYGRLAPFSLRPSGTGTARTIETLKMFAVSGIWTIKADNDFELEKRHTGWSGHDTIMWSGGQSLQLLQLDRSFAHETGLEEHDAAEDLTEIEIEELVEANLNDSGLIVKTPLEIESVTSEIHPLAPFVLVCWDSVTGEGKDRPLRFPGFFAAVRHLAAYEQQHDQLIRVQGAGSDTHIGFRGSKNFEFENLRSARFRLGLKRLALRMIRRKAYRPIDAADLVSLCNGTLSTLHVEYAGYVKDLLWASSPDQQEELLEELEIPEDLWNEWTNQTEFPVDLYGERLALESIDNQTWNLLEPKTRHFISTALHQLAEQGSAPQLDYAPISIEVVKGLEVEMGALLADFKHRHTHETLQFHDGDIAEKALDKFLHGNKSVTLGNLPYLLKRQTHSASALRRAFHHYIESLPNREFLLHRRFESSLHRVINTFRNGGAHDSAIREDICRECVKTLVGSTGNPGLIAQFAMWKLDDTLHSEVNA